MDVDELYERFLVSTGICTDTRLINKGSIFFALKGGSFNGNKFASKALEEGCSFVVVDEEVHSIPENKVFKVDDVLRTLQLLANRHRHSFAGKVIALTGSNGKTTTKELLAAVLKSKFKVSFTKGNLNNHIGVPLTILSTPKDVDFLVVEMGANHQKEIETLCRIADPDYGLIANIGLAHLEGFGGIEGVRKGKTEMYRYMSAKGKKVFFNNDEISIADFKQTLKSPIEYGADTDIAVRGFSMKNSFLQVSLVVNGSEIAVNSKLFGAYNVNNILTAAAVGAYFGVLPEEIKYSLEAYTPSNNRSQVEVTVKGNELVVDAYNANPTSMKNAITQFLEINPKDSLLIIGEMKELGELADIEHQNIIDLVEGKNCTVYFVGDLFRKNLKFGVGKYFLNAKELIGSGDLEEVHNKKVLIKGSRSVALEQIIPLF